MKKTLIYLIALFLASCATYDKNISIDNVGSSQEVVLKNLSDKNVVSIAIKVTGYIEGNATLVLMLNDKPYKTESISSNVDFKWGADWYSNDAIIIYETKNVKKGNLSIDYTFGTL